MTRRLATGTARHTLASGKCLALASSALHHCMEGFLRVNVLGTRTDRLAGEKGKNVKFNKDREKSKRKRPLANTLCRYTVTSARSRLSTVRTMES